MGKAKPKAAASKAKGAGGVPGGAILAAVLVVAVAAAMGLLFPWGVAAPEAPPEQPVGGVAEANPTRDRDPGPNPSQADASRQPGGAAEAGEPRQEEEAAAAPAATAASRRGTRR